MAGSIERAIRVKLSPRTSLRTFGRSKAFVLEEINEKGIVLLLGEKRAWTPFRWDCIEGVATFLKGKGWVVGGSKYEVDGDPSTLDGYLKGCINGATANWVARVLYEAGVIHVDQGPPLRVRLKPGF
jgi:hypothetical protein